MYAKDSINFDIQLNILYYNVKTIINFLNQSNLTNENLIDSLNEVSISNVNVKFVTLACNHADIYKKKKYKKLTTCALTNPRSALCFSSRNFSAFNSE